MSREDELLKIVEKSLRELIFTVDGKPTYHYLDNWTINSLLKEIKDGWDAR